jgi:hypothetical protein
LIDLKVNHYPNFAKWPGIIAQECGHMRDDITREYATQVRRALISTDSVVSSKTLNSVRDRKGYGSQTQFRGHVTMVKTWLFTQRGRGPGKMPIAKTGVSLKTGRATFQPLPEVASWFLARGVPREAWWPILRSIGRKGTKGKFFLGKAMANARTRLLLTFRGITLAKRLVS